VAKKSRICTTVAKKSRICEKLSPIFQVFRRASGVAVEVKHLGEDSQSGQSVTNAFYHRRHGSCVRKHLAFIVVILA
jgi:hypothetical protein